MTGYLILIKYAIYFLIYWQKYQDLPCYSYRTHSHEGHENWYPYYKMYLYSYTYSQDNFTLIHLLLHKKRIAWIVRIKEKILVTNKSSFRLQHY